MEKELTILNRQILEIEDILKNRYKCIDKQNNFIEYLKTDVVP